MIHLAEPRREPRCDFGLFFENHFPGSTHFLQVAAVVTAAIDTNRTMSETQFSVCIWRDYRTLWPAELHQPVKRKEAASGVSRAHGQAVLSAGSKLLWEVMARDVKVVQHVVSSSCGKPETASK